MECGLVLTGQLSKMNKRTFLRYLGAGSLSLGLSSFRDQDSFGVLNGGNPTPLKAFRLKEGDNIGIISPSAAIAGELPFLLAEESFQALGLNVRWGKHSRDRWGHLAGTDEARLEDIHTFFKDPEIKAIVCLRGGSGAARLLDRLDYQLIARNPKIFLGYSDITALLNAIQRKTGLITFHGPVGLSTWSNELGRTFRELFFEKKELEFHNPENSGGNLTQRNDRILTIREGQAEGLLLGGNLSVLCGIAGSPFFPDFEDSILFLEEVDEEPYRVDNFFAQLKLSGALTKIKGFVFGHCTNCEPDGGYGSLTIDEIIDDYIRPLKIPAFKGARIGHISNQFFLPVGARVRIDAGAGSITMLEHALKD